MISIPWLRTRTVEKRYTGVMGIPREFTLVEQNGDIFLKQMPVYTIEKNQRLIGSGIVGTTKENSLRVFQEHKCVIKIDTKIFLIKNEIVEWYIYDVKISYEIGTGRLIVEEEEINIGKNISDVSIIFDKGIIEITANYGIIYAVFESNSQKETGDISIDLKIIEEVNIYQII